MSSYPMGFDHMGSDPMESDPIGSGPMGAEGGVVAKSNQ